MAKAGLVMLSAAFENQLIGTLGESADTMPPNVTAWFLNEVTTAPELGLETRMRLMRLAGLPELVWSDDMAKESWSATRFCRLPMSKPCPDTLPVTTRLRMNASHCLSAAPRSRPVTSGRMLELNIGIDYPQLRTLPKLTSGSRI